MGLAQPSGFVDVEPSQRAHAEVTCKICGGRAGLHFETLVLRTRPAAFHYCPACDHVFAANPTWLDEAYTDAIVSTDTDIAIRNINTALRLASLLHFGLGDRPDAKYTDAAGGYGLLTRLMRDFGFDFYWSDRYAENLFARGFEVRGDLAEKHSAVTAVEVLEHTIDPLKFLQEALLQSNADTVIFTTQVFDADMPPKAEDWDYYALESGQHIAFFSLQGLQRLADRLGMTFIPLGRLHLFTKRNVSRRRLNLSTNKLLLLPLAAMAMRARGSKRNADRTRMTKILRGQHSP